MTRRSAVGLLAATPGIYPTRHSGAQWWPTGGLGLFLHWGIASVDGRGDLSWYMIADTPWDPGGMKLPPEQYFRLAERFNPENYNPGRWLAAAKRAGFRYAVLTSRHHDGYAMWPSGHGEFSTRTHMGGRDLVRPFLEACRSAGLRSGLYYSPPDWHYNRQWMSFRYNNKGRHGDLPPLGLRHEVIAPPRRSEQESTNWERHYLAYIRGQVEELLTGYGPIDVIWFDGGPAAIEIDRIRQLQPAIVVNPRMHKTGDFTTAEVHFPKQRPEGWWEFCAMWQPKWGYTADESFRPLGAILAEFVQTRSWGGNYLINIGPRPDGELPSPAYRLLAEMAEWMRHSAVSVLDVEAGSWPAGSNVPTTRRKNVWYLHALPDYGCRVELAAPGPPERARLLRTGQPLRFRYEGGAVRVAIPEALRTPLVDTVELEFPA